MALSGEFFQYWLGAYEQAPAGGATAGSHIAPVDGIRPPFSGLSWGFSDTGIAPGRELGAGRRLLRHGRDDRLGLSELAGRTAARYEPARPMRPDPSGPSRYGTGTGAVVETPWSLLFGFGFEDIAGADAAGQVMGRALRFLLAPR